MARLSKRRGISLLEVLISMFVLLFGLMGVAAIFPLGNHYAGKGEQYDRGSALADAAFAELKARGMLRPELWLYAEQPTSAEGATQTNARLIQAGGTQVFNITPSTDAGPGNAFVLDPMGVAAGWADFFQRRPSGKYDQSDMDLDVFPKALFTGRNFTGAAQVLTESSNTVSPWHEDSPDAVAPFLEGKRWPIRRLTLPTTNPNQPTMSRTVAETIFRLRDDLTNDTPGEDDRPGMQRFAVDNNGTPDIPADDIPLARQYAGSYSWIATIVPKRLTAPHPFSGNLTTSTSALLPSHSEFRSQEYDVSVAVFHKRDVLPSAESERSIKAALNIGGELVLYADISPDGVSAVDNALKDIRPGQWIALAGIHPTVGMPVTPGTSGLLLLKWYRILSLDDETVRSERIDPTNTSGALYSLRRAMLEDVDWPAPLNLTTGEPVYPIQNLRALIMPGVISVSGPHPMTMERN
jgi:hypothetical protein